jgi:hypothetical protein
MGTLHGVITDGDLFVLDQSKVYREDRDFVWGLATLIDLDDKGKSTVVEFRWDYRANVYAQWATLFFVRKDGKRLDSNILIQDNFSKENLKILRYLMRYDYTVRSKKPNKMKRGWS